MLRQIRINVIMRETCMIPLYAVVCVAVRSISHVLYMYICIYGLFCRYMVIDEVKKYTL